METFFLWQNCLSEQNMFLWQNLVFVERYYFKFCVATQHIFIWQKLVLSKTSFLGFYTWFFGKSFHVSVISDNRDTNFVEPCWFLWLITTIDNKHWFLSAVRLAKTSNNVVDCDWPEQWFDITDSPNTTVLGTLDFKSAYFDLFDAKTKTKLISEPSWRVY